MSITQKLQSIQLELKAPKNQRNAFGKYNYRSAEDILEAIKPYAKKHNVLFKITEELQEIGGMVYVKSTAKVIDVDDTSAIESIGSAIIDFDAKGMQMPQRTGEASSDAKKYALGNLLILHDTKDTHATNQHGKGSPATKKTLPTLDKNHEKYEKVKKFLEEGGNVNTVLLKFNVVDKELLNLINQ